MGTSLPDLLHESLCSVKEQSSPQTPADKTDGLLFLRRTFPGGWKGAEELSLSCCNFSSLPSLTFPSYIISLEPHVFKSPSFTHLHKHSQIMFMHHTHLGVSSRDTLDECIELNEIRRYHPLGSTPLTLHHLQNVEQAC